MNSISFYVVKIKKNIIPLFFLLFIFLLLIFSKFNLPAVKSGLSLWANSVVPSLFPFFVATECLMNTNIVYFFGKFLSPIMRPVFNVSGEGGFAFIMGIISGYPVGAKIACNFRKNNICSKEECERLLSFTNNSGPLFIIGTVGIIMFGNTTIGIMLFITHILASISVGFIFRFWKKNKSSTPVYSKNYFNDNKKNSVRISDIGEILSKSITSSISTILMIGGFVVIFSSIISIFNASGIFNLLKLIFLPIFKFLNLDTALITPIITGFLEITNGINLVANIHLKKISINIIIVAFLLGFGGISVMLQVWSIISKSDLSIRPYIYGKLLHGILASFYTYLFFNLFPFFSLDL